MSFTYGFYNSLNGDRKYNATQFGEMFDGLINDGIYSTIGDAFAVTPGSGLGVKVGTGRCWFNKTWSVNSTVLPLSLDLADLLLPRIDAVIIEIDTRVVSRTNSIKVITGTPAVTPAKPALTRSDGLYQYPLAWVRVEANVESIAASKIENNIGLTPTPFVTGIVQQATLDQLWTQWNGQFNEWFDGVKAALSGDIASNLLNRIVALEDSRVKITDKATVAQATAGVVDKWIDGATLQGVINSGVVKDLRTGKKGNIRSKLLYLGHPSAYFSSTVSDTITAKYGIVPTSNMSPKSMADLSEIGENKYVVPMPKLMYVESSDTLYVLTRQFTQNTDVNATEGNDNSLGASMFKIKNVSTNSPTVSTITFSTRWSFSKFSSFFSYFPITSSRKNIFYINTGSTTIIGFNPDSDKVVVQGFDYSTPAYPSNRARADIFITNNYIGSVELDDPGQIVFHYGSLGSGVSPNASSSTTVPNFGTSKTVSITGGQVPVIPSIISDFRSIAMYLLYKAYTIIGCRDDSVYFIYFYNGKTVLSKYNLSTSTLTSEITSITSKGTMYSLVYIDGYVSYVMCTQVATNSCYSYSHLLKVNIYNETILNGSSLVAYNTNNAELTIKDVYTDPRLDPSIGYGLFGSLLYIGSKSGYAYTITMAGALVKIEESTGKILDLKMIRGGNNVYTEVFKVYRIVYKRELNIDYLGANVVVLDDIINLETGEAWPVSAREDVSKGICVSMVTGSSTTKLPVAGLSSISSRTVGSRNRVYKFIGNGTGENSPEYTVQLN